MEEAWTFLKARRVVGGRTSPPPPRQTSLHEYSSDYDAPIGAEALEQAKIDARGRFVDALARRGKRERLMGLKPQQFHMTSTQTERPLPHPKEGRRLGQFDGPKKHGDLEATYDWIQEQLEGQSDYWTHPDMGEYGGMDEDLGELMSSMFGRKMYGLHAPRETLESHLTPDTIQRLEAGRELGEFDQMHMQGHEGHLKEKVPIGYASMSGPHVGYVNIRPELRGMGLGSKFMHEILGREGGLISALRTDKGQMMANRMLSMLGSKAGSALARKLGKLPSHAELGPLHNMKLRDKESLTESVRGRIEDFDPMSQEITHAHLPEVWGSLRPDISTMPYSETKLPPRQRAHHTINPQTRIIPEESHQERTQPWVRREYWEDPWDRQQNRLAQEEWKEFRPDADEPSNWRTNPRIPWYMRHLFQEDEPEHINEPSDYAYDPDAGVIRTGLGSLFQEQPEGWMSGR